MNVKNLLAVGLLLFAVGGLAWVVLNPQGGPPPEESPEAAPAEGVTVYCFHGNIRCPTCNKIESYTHETLQNAFAAELGDGRLHWRVVNFESPGNAHFMDDFQMITSCIVLVDNRPGKQGRFENLQQKVWELADDKPAFVQFIDEQVRAFLAQ